MIVFVIVWRCSEIARAAVGFFFAAGDTHGSFAWREGGDALSSPP